MGEEETCSTCKNAVFNKYGQFAGCFRGDMPNGAPLEWPEVAFDDLCDEWGDD